MTCAQVRASAAFACFANAESAFATVKPSPTARSSRPVWYHDGHDTSSEHATRLAPDSQNHRGAVSVGAQVGSPQAAPSVVHSRGSESADRAECVDSRDEGYAQDNPLQAQTYTRATCTSRFHRSLMFYEKIHSDRTPPRGVSAVTGEEDEEVKAEVKGAKVFIKRGASDFGNGILGHVKLLSHKETADERLGQCRPPMIFCDYRLT